MKPPPFRCLTPLLSPNHTCMAEPKLSRWKLYLLRSDRGGTLRASKVITEAGKRDHSGNFANVAPEFVEKYRAPFILMAFVGDSVAQHILNALQVKR